MNSPSHHLSEEILEAYASGDCVEALSLLTATHLTYCETCRARVQSLEQRFGLALENENTAPLHENSLESVLAKIDQPKMLIEQTASEDFSTIDSRLPRPLARYVKNASHPAWRFLAPGVRTIALPLMWNGETVRLVELKPGMLIPQHGHRDVEHTLVLTGGYRDEAASFGPGDVSTRTPGMEHHLRIDRSEPCVALVVQAGRVIPKTLRGKVLQLIAGI